FVTLPVAELLMVAWIVKTTKAPGGRSTVVLMLPLPLDEPTLAPLWIVVVQVWLLMPVGKLFVTVAPLTELGPALKTTTVKMPFAPGAADPFLELSLWKIWRSAT